MDYIDIFNNTVYVMMAVFLAAVAGGVGIKLYLMMIAILAFPTYIGLYMLELMLLCKRSGERVFSLNIPKDNPRKIAMNLSASCVTVSLLSLIWPLFESGFTLESPRNWIESLFDGKLLDPFFCLLFLTGGISVFVISQFFSEKDDRDFFTKISSISIPTLWRVVVKDFGNP